MLQKLNELGCELLPYLPYSLDLSQTDWQTDFKHLDNFSWGKQVHNQQEVENDFQ